jgi:hypothetical protein
MKIRRKKRRKTLEIKIVLHKQKDLEEGEKRGGKRAEPISSSNF